MTRICFTAVAVALISLTVNAKSAVAQYAAQVISYNAGSTPAASFTTPSAALGEPERFTGEGVFPSVVSPFSPPYLSNELVSVGEGGQITLRLSNYAVAQGGGLPELGIFGNVGLIDTDYPNGHAGTPAGTFSPLGSPTVEVSADGASWFNFGSVTLDVPTNGYTDLNDPFAAAPGSALSDFQKPFVGTIDSFSGLPYSHASNPDMLDLLAGSGGGKWLDISAAGIPQVGYVRLSLADDGLANTSLKFDLDAFSVSHAALGIATVPEPAAMALVLMVLLPAAMRRQPRRRLVEDEAVRAMPTR